MNADAFLQELGAIEQGRRELRERAMIYQADAKERAALRDGLPPSAYYYLPFEQWRTIANRIPPCPVPLP